MYSIRNSFIIFKKLTKSGLSLSVVFSSIIGYLLAFTDFSLNDFILLCFGGYCVVGSSSVFNQIIERDLDAIMKRTKIRPLPTKKISVNVAFVIGLLMALLGLWCLYMINIKTALFSAISMFLYTCVYTPLKLRSPLSVFVGAIPGAIPFMLGWVAVDGEFGVETGALFLIQFLWQFPHFWSIAWMLDDDYKKAGFKMLPTNKKNNIALVQIILYSIWTVIASLLPYFGLTGRLSLTTIGAILILLLGVGMVYFSIKLYITKDNKSARNMMLASVGYLTFMQITLVLDKWFFQ